MKQNASLDTSFWINCHRIGILDKIFEYFNLHVCDEVKEEILSPLSRLGILAQDADIFQQKLNQNEITITSYNKISKETFHTAENKAIGLAEEMGFILLIDNGAPFEYAMTHGLKVVNTASFIVFLCFEGKLTAQNAKLKLMALKGLIRESIIMQNLKRINVLGGE
jgi:hypothetical protein